MPRLASFYGIVVYMYWSDHPPPHFHAEYSDHQAVITIDDGIVFAGSLPRRALRLLQEWRTLHRRELLDAWDSLRSATIRVRSSRCHDQSRQDSEGR